MNHPKKEKTLVIIKPDGVQRGLIGEIIKRVERTGLKLVGMKMEVLSEKKLWDHYNKDDKWYLEKGTRILENRKRDGKKIEKDAIDYGKEIIGNVVKYMQACPVVSMVWEGNQAVSIVKKIVGVTEPSTSDVGTIRGDFTIDSYPLTEVDGRAVRNLIHCTDKAEESQREIDIWFDKKDLTSYRLVQEEILYDVNLDGILE